MIQPFWNQLASILTNSLQPFGLLLKPIFNSLGVPPKPIFKPGKYFQKSKITFLQQKINNALTFLESIASLLLHSLQSFNLLPRPLFNPWEYFQSISSIHESTSKGPKEFSYNKESTMLQHFWNHVVSPKRFHHC